MVNISSSLVFFVNGNKVTVENPNPEWTLLYYLRNKLRLCGTKLGCGEGGCGACTVMVSKYLRKERQIIHFPVNACLAPVCSMHGLAVTTVEGIGSTNDKLHPIQERLAKTHGSQCGFCTPGFVMSMYTLLRNMEKPLMDDIEVAFQGNLCRCTGYRSIIDAFRSFGDARMNSNGACPMGENCCKVNGKVNGQMNGDQTNGCQSNGNQTNGGQTNGSQTNGCKTNGCKTNGSQANCGNTNGCQSNGSQNNGDQANGYGRVSEQEVIFPPELKLDASFDTQYLCYKSDSTSWFRPTQLSELLALKQQHTGARIVAGNTEIGVEVKFKRIAYPVLIQPTVINELNDWKLVQDEGLVIGAGITLDHFEQILNGVINSERECKTRIFVAFKEMLHWFAGKQIRSVASIGGNLLTASPISDLNPLLLAAGCVAEVRSVDVVKHIKIDEKFFVGYRKTILNDDDVLINIFIPFTRKNQYFLGHKQARRRDDDIAIVNAAINVEFVDGSLIVNDLKLAFGGLAPKTIMTIDTAHKLIGLHWNDELLSKAYDCLGDEIDLPVNSPGGMVNYRKTLALCFFFRSYLTILNKVNCKSFDQRDLSGIEKFTAKPTTSTQIYDISNGKAPVGKPIIHQSAYKQVSGEAVYLDDIPSYENEWHMALVYTQKAHALIKSVNFEKALNVEGVRGYLCSDDLPKHRNKFGPIVADEELFITQVTTSQYQIIGAILADDQFTAQKAAKLVEVVYEELEPVLVSIEDAILHNSFFPVTRKIECGNVDSAFSECSNLLTGECRTGYQEHFYFETQGCLVVPREDELQVFSSTQHHAEATEFIGKVLNIPQNRIVTRVKRLGGGFGGKQSRASPIAIVTALAAQKYKRPVRLILDRDEDMAMTGGRHPYLIKYTMGFDDNGRILAYEAHLFANGGYSTDLSIEVLERAVMHVENAYKIPNVRVIGRICKTNLPSNTAFRGFGAPQAMLAAENMLRRVAEHLNKDYIEVCRLNLYSEGDCTHYNEVIENCNLKQCLEECLITCNYEKRKKEIEIYNKKNRWKKRGISTVCTKYGVGYGVPFLEQSGALVMIYRDGSVLLTHGGVEMGQGLHTKMIQVAANVLEIPIERIYTSEASTDKVPNTSPCAASVGSDLNGMAVMRACIELKKRLEPIRAKNPNAQWDDLIETAYMQQVSLSATGFFATPDILYNWETNQGKPYNYFTFGASCSEVEIDCLTGDHQLLRTDIVMDLGNSLNPAIDVTQIEGAFMQGYGLYMLEEMLYSPQGTIMSKGPGAYKIPGFSDVPAEFNVSLLKGVSNPRAVFSSKAVGEPPLFLASSALFATREAIKAARLECGIDSSFVLNAPATAEKIRMLCVDNITNKIKNNEDVVKNSQRWNVVP